MTELELRLAASRLTLLVRMTEYVRCAELYVERYGNYQCGYDVDTDETIVIQHD